MTTPSLSSLAVTIGKNGSSSDEYHFNLMGGVGNPEDYTDLINTLRTAKAGDTVNIHINSYGGQIRTAVQIVNNIESTEATVVGHLEGECHSAATIILLACDSWVIYKNTIALFHQYSSASWGEGHKIEAHAKAIKRWVDELNSTYYKNFLSEKELKKMNKGKDYYFECQELYSRLEMYDQARKVQQKALENEEKQAIYRRAKSIIEEMENDPGSNS
jgi:ATP-dependent protease ClpP protease subunit